MVGCRTSELRLAVHRSVVGSSPTRGATQVSLKPRRTCSSIRWATGKPPRDPDSGPTVAGFRQDVAPGYALFGLKLRRGLIADG